MSATKVPTTAADGAKDPVLVAALATGLSMERAAKEAACSVSTVQRRLDDPVFTTKLIEAKNDLTDRLLASNLNAALAATNFLLRVMLGEEPDVTMNHRIRAALALRSGLVELDRHVSET